MAAKRLSDDLDNFDPKQPNHKQQKTPSSSASAETNEVVMANILENIIAILEPRLRRMVKEEVENGLKRNLLSIMKSPSLSMQAPEPPKLQLRFSEELSLPIFSGSKIVDINGNHLQILLVDTTGCRIVPSSLPYSIKIEIVVLDGDFPHGDLETWTSEEFDANIQKERTGKRPLLTGRLKTDMRDGMASIGDVEFTDNSSWIRSRRFRLGVKVVQGTSREVEVKIRPGITEPFVVKDGRGENAKKHYPPALQDEVWRLDGIRKDGVFHEKLSAEGINTVQDLLKLSAVDLHKLGTILGRGMSKKTLDVTLKHARTCVMGTKHYILRSPTYTITFSPVCEVVQAVINGQVYAAPDFTPMRKACIENLKKEAWANWHSLEEVDAQLNDTALLMTGDVVNQTTYQQQPITRAYNPQEISSDGSSGLTSNSKQNGQHEFTDDWANTSQYLL